MAGALAFSTAVSWAMAAAGATRAVGRGRRAPSATGAKTLAVQTLVLHGELVAAAARGGLRARRRQSDVWAEVGER